MLFPFLNFILVFILLLLLFSFFFFWPRRAACGILVPQPGIEPATPTLEAWSLNHRTARDVPVVPIFLDKETGGPVTCPKLPSWEVIENSQCGNPAGHLVAQKQNLRSDLRGGKEQPCHKRWDAVPGGRQGEQ